MELPMIDTLILLTISVVAISLGWLKLYSDYSANLADFKPPEDEGWSIVHRLKASPRSTAGSSHRTEDESRKERIVVTEAVFSKAFFWIFTAIVIMSIIALSPMTATLLAIIMGHVLKKATRAYQVIDMNMKIKFLILSFLSVCWLRSARLALVSPSRSLTYGQHQRLLVRALDDLQYACLQLTDAVEHELWRSSYNTVTSVKFVLFYFGALTIAIVGWSMLLKRALKLRKSAVPNSETSEDLVSYDDLISAMRSDRRVQIWAALAVFATVLWFKAHRQVQFALFDNPYTVLGVPTYSSASHKLRAWNWRNRCRELTTSTELTSSSNGT